MRRPFRVALFIETSRGYGRGLLRGVIRFLRQHGAWSIHVRPRGLGERPPAWLASWDGDGILVRADRPEWVAAVAASGIPAVDLRLSFEHPGLPAVGIDSRAIAELAAGHLRDAGFRHLGFCGLPRGENRWADYRADCFRAAAAAAGMPCGVFAPRPRRRPSPEAELRAVADWLTGLPRPVGVMAVFDDRGLEVLEACRLAGLRVPDEVGVVGVDNDELLCTLSDPPLSSVDGGVERAGFAAAGLLDRMMRGEPAPAAPIFLSPVGVVARLSTDVLAVDDPELAAFIRELRERACDGVRVGDAAAGAGLSPSTLKRRFVALLGRTPKAEVTRVRMERAKGLLTTTDLPVAEVAVRCGFPDLKHLSRAFRAAVGTTPTAYRRQGRNDPSG